MEANKYFFSDEDIKEINYKRKNEDTKLYNGEMTETEYKQIIQYNDKKPMKLQGILAKVFHKIFQIPIKPEGNDIEDFKILIEKLVPSITPYTLRITIYDLTQAIIYQSHSKECNINITLLLIDHHYRVITSLSGFLCNRNVNPRKNVVVIVQIQEQNCLSGKQIVCEYCNKTYTSNSVMKII